MLSEILEGFCKIITMKRKEDFRTLFIISLAWISLIINWKYIFTLENKRKSIIFYFFISIK